MRKLYVFGCLLSLLFAMAACNDYETYAEQKEKENNAISQFIKNHFIKVITESEFREKSYTTDVNANEYVLINSSGVYMQIVRKGCGTQLRDGETATVLCRFEECNVFTDTLTLSNKVLAFTGMVDKMYVTRSSDSYSALFYSKEESVMYYVYGYSDVPSAWLTPLNYINLGRPSNENEEIARVKLIVPSSQGTYNAVTNVVPYFYDITYERGL